MTTSFTPAFSHALAFVLAREGGYVNDPTDKGGETKYGISDKRDGLADAEVDDAVGPQLEGGAAGG